MKMKNVWYLYDEKLKKELNDSGLDYTPAYIPAILIQLGVTAKPCAPENIQKLNEKDILLTGAQRLDEIPKNIGGVILLGSSVGKNVLNLRRDSAIYGYFETDNVSIPLFVPISKRPSNAQGKILSWAKTDTGKFPALIKYEQNIYEFGFDLAATIWYSGDGFENKKSSHGFFIGRTPDARPLPKDTDTSYPYNDILLNILENILSDLGVPMLYRLPPLNDGSLPDFALHISGDDEASSYEINKAAATCMRDLELPYHLNLMSNNGDFVVKPEYLPELETLDCEVALHSDFTAVPYTEDGQKSECDKFTKWFGASPFTNTNHCLIQGGSTAERLRWLSECGIVADNSKLGEVDLSDINAFNLCGFGFGTAFPRYTCDDAAHGNFMLYTMEIPITYYEPRLSMENEKYCNEEKITNYIDNAALNGWLIQFFIHPQHLSLDIPDKKWTVTALKCAKRYWEGKGYHPLLTTTNRIAQFWKERSQAIIKINDSAIEITCECPVFIRLPYYTNKVIVNGSFAEVIHKEINGSEISLVLINNHKSTIVIPD